MVTALYHFYQPVLTLSLAAATIISESFYVYTKKKNWKNIAVFFGILLIINYILYVISSIWFEFQLGTNWQKYTDHTASIGAEPWAIIALSIFVLKIILLTLWLLSYKWLSPKKHYILSWFIIILC